ncbi:capsule assembly Wzi family protein [Dyadobacter sandarakinus]|uniref:Capsule assembly protein Wzi n=1 Tax=Dyadobacter sandarakinus TaxID=2747268 RepID=A0ABX7I7K2_9BACT|nr:capsule assembly Wzi family protein [Dyadobacter sandarakinus]QRR01875.1 hypothetical protein HWI92_13635 [Dyadobacter sandarakinus]
MFLSRFTTHALLLFFLLIFSRVAAQQSSFSSQFKGNLEAGAYASDSRSVPFWLRTNQFGIVPERFPAGIIQGNLRKDYVFFDTLKNKVRRLDWGVALNPVVTYDDQSKLKAILAEAHVKVRFRHVELYIGRRKEVMGLGDTTLSSGFYAGSGNALPIPKIQIGTVGFAPLHFTRDFVAVNAGFAHGWFWTDYIQDIRLHQKYLYVRLGKPAAASKFYFGLNHNVMWGGHAEYLKQHPELALNGVLPSSWKFYPNVVLAFTSKNWFTKNGYGAFDSYRLGNHLGSYDIGFDTRIAGRKLWVYHQHPFEDVSSMVFKNLPDGLYGANLKLQSSTSGRGFAITHITAEFLTTKDQSGSTFYIPGSKFQGADNYFNHSQYYEGWSYRGNTVGTPFIAPGKDMDRVPGRFFPSNRVNMWYLGAQGQSGRLLLTLRTSYSRNFGVPGGQLNPVRNQFSGMLAGQYSLPRQTAIIARFSTDQGTLFLKSSGGYLGIRKSW